MRDKKVQIEDSWYHLIRDEFTKPNFEAIKAFLISEKSKGKTIYPPGPLIFNAFNTTPADQVKVVILGQDPYHRPGQAMGLSFSVPQGIRTPPSLVNIYKEIRREFSTPIPDHGDLTAWAKQGVFLLNAMLTVEEGKAGSHQKIGWQHFTDAVIQAVSHHRDHVVFMLWGNFAKAKRTLIDADRHLILEAAHPSPLAGNRFSGCSHFSKANAYLTEHGQKPIDWSLPS